MHVTDRLARPISVVLILAAFAGATGCETSLQLLVGKKGDVSESPAIPGTTAGTLTGSPSNTAFLSDSDLMPGFSGESVLPPTLAFEGDQGGPQAADANPGGPHRPIAITPLTSDAKVLSGLAKAAKREPGSAASKFVLLVLTPPATDAETLDRDNTASRTTASAAIKVLGDAGIPADHIDISLATNPDVAGQGEVRLYRR